MFPLVFKIQSKDTETTSTFDVFADWILKTKGLNKGQLISKCLVGVFKFFKKNRTKQVDTRYHSSEEDEFFRSFFGRIEDTKKSLLSDL